MKLVDLPKLRQMKKDDIHKLMEIVMRSTLIKSIPTFSAYVSSPGQLAAAESFHRSKMSNNELKQVIDAGLLTFLLHCEARIASNVGVGFYTIGPCGEELLAATSLHLRSTDACALHYRHVSKAICRQLMAGDKTVDEIALDRARGFVCSVLDPVTGGKHCSIGGGKHDFLVTSTLASQAPPAVGRALGISLSNRLIPDECLMPRDALSYVSVGDGSVNNAHFLAALNLAKYAAHRNMKCPVVFAVSDNQKCISLRGFGWIDEFVKGSGVKSFVADGNDVSEIYTQARAATGYTRTFQKPSLLLYSNLPRRFGHAATDRQSSYMSDEEILSEAQRNPLENVLQLGVTMGLFSSQELQDKIHGLQQVVEQAFDRAVLEPKISSREDLVASNSSRTLDTAASRQIKKDSKIVVRRPWDRDWLHAGNKSGLQVFGGAREVMRKQMTRVYDEILSRDKGTVYIGEDVEHGGYYLVTDGLAKKHPGRVRDFPPDETTLVGVAIGFSQLSLVPILEIPYSKYLDCATDMFHEAIISHWLTDGRQPNGMLVRLQGFDRGVFGGNFHTHNMLTIPPGLDVVCYSNGEDYVRGIRYAMMQARAGRVVMSVDSTDLLNKRHLDIMNKDDMWLSYYPPLPDNADELFTFDQVVVYKPKKEKEKEKEELRGQVQQVSKASVDGKKRRATIAIVSYGNGMPVSLIAMDRLCESHGFNPDQIIVIDCPYLSKPPQQLRKMLSTCSSKLRVWDIDTVIFADVCKEGAGMPLGGIAITLQNEGYLSNKTWRAIGASYTYNPLGRTLTFLNEEDIIQAVLQVETLH